MDHAANSIAPRLTVALFLSLILLATSADAKAQQRAASPSEDRDRGIQLYQKGEIAAAIKVLEKVTKKHTDDSDAWYFLGLAYNSEGAIVSGRAAFERLLRLRPAVDRLADVQAKLAYAYILANELQNATAMARRAIELNNQAAEPHYAIAEANLRIGEFKTALQEAEIALELKHDFAPALITKSLAHYSMKQYAEAATALEKYLAIKSTDADGDLWREQLVQLRDREPANSVEGVSSALNVPVTGRDITVKARVLSKPEPTYTEAARKAGVTGTVVIRAVFSSEGEIRNLIVTRALSYGLTSKAVQAARRIRFVPATKEGKPVSMWIQLEYNFNLY
ncbi:MAG: hypothetical protein DMF70_12235 [Acidobacteria bacterium]|nr:MAG: hypothetical protein DMF70_12235 [Acidobacteriota bacterium]